ncbi:hypothetical protein [Pseudomonas sp. NPDC086251]|uniref:hypothetical protein n=1 Tax=Pseudomonas sp. NPDC086251 TaxID=3364431 RepID=UPI003832D8BB
MTSPAVMVNVPGLSGQAICPARFTQMKYGYFCACLFLLSPLTHALEPTNASIRFEGIVTDPSCQITPAALRVDVRRPELPIHLFECRTSVHASLGTSTNTQRYLKNQVLRSDTLIALPKPKVARENMVLTLDYF